MATATISGVLISGDLHLVCPPAGGEMFLLGSDRLGRDLLSRIIYGARISLTVGLIGITISFMLGIVIGGIAGYYGGWTDMLIQRVIEVIQSFPHLPLWMALSAILPVTWSPLLVYFGITLILGMIEWTHLARAVRSKLLSLREEDFCTAAVLMGAKPARIIGRHLLPSFMSHLIASATLTIPGMILGETALSFLGLGLRPPITSWGVLLERGAEYQRRRALPMADAAGRPGDPDRARVQFSWRRAARRGRPVSLRSDPATDRSVPPPGRLGRGIAGKISASLIRLEFRMSNADFHELFPMGHDDTPYRKLTGDYVAPASFDGQRVVKVAPEALTLLAREAFVDCQHLLRPGHLAQLRAILDDPEASANDRFVAFDLLKNANIAAGKVLPMCQDTGTAIVMGKKGQMSGPAATTRRRCPRASAGHIPRPICATARWRPCRCTRRSIPATICRRRSTSTPSPATSTNSCSSPRAAARPTRAFCTSRPRRC